jgi:hypothetical protein
MRTPAQGGGTSVLTPKVNANGGDSWAFFEVVGIPLAIGHLYYRPGCHVTLCNNWPKPLDFPAKTCNT